MVGERSALSDRDAHRVEELGRDAVHVRARPVLRRHRRLPLRGVEDGRIETAERRIGREARRHHARNRARALEKRSRGHDERRRRGRGIGIRRGGRARNAHPERQHRLGIEARIERRQLLHAVDHQPGADQEHDRERHFGDDERAAHPLRSPAVAAARRVLQRLGEPRHAAVQRRREAEQEAASDRHEHGEGGHPQVDVRIDEARKVDRTGRHQRTDRCLCEHEAGDSAERRQHAAFGDQLTQQPRPPRAERGPHRDLALARFRSRNQQIRHIRAGNQQHETDRRHQHRQRETERSKHLDVEWADLDSAFLIRLRIRLLEATRNRVQLGLRLGDCDAGLQPGQHLKSAIAALSQPLGGVAHDERNPDIGAVAEATETRRHDADDGERLRIEQNRAADDPRVAAELTLPEPVGEHGDRDLLWHHVLAGEKRASMRWIDAEQ